MAKELLSRAQISDEDVRSLSIPGIATVDELLASSNSDFEIFRALQIDVKFALSRLERLVSKAVNLFSSDLLLPLSTPFNIIDFSKKMRASVLRIRSRSSLPVFGTYRIEKGIHIQVGPAPAETHLAKCPFCKNHKAQGIPYSGYLINFVHPDSPDLSVTAAGLHLIREHGIFFSPGRKGWHVDVRKIVGAALLNQTAR